MNDERRTPKWLFDALDEKFNFTLDAAASDDNHLVERYYTKETNGLVQPWSGETVWCNPPYSRGQIVKWLKKAALSRAEGATTLLLIPGDSSTKASQLALRYADAILFLNKRLHFNDGETAEKNSAKFASWIVLFCPARDRRRHVANLVLANIGIVL